MTGEVAIEIDLSKVFKQISAYKGAFKPLTILKAVGLSNLRWVTKNFDSEGASVGGWEGLSEKTKARRRGSVYKILKDTGSLRQSFDLYGIRGIKIAGRTFEIGSNKIYAATHHYGDSSRGIPKRQILPTPSVGQKLGIDLLDARLKQLKVKHG